MSPEGVETEHEYKALYRKRRYLHGGPLKARNVGVRRRLQALFALGYDDHYVGELLGVTAAAVYQMRGNGINWHSTYERVAEVYERLSGRRPIPANGYQAAWIERRKATARERGWAVPLAWDDIDNPRERPKGIAA